MDRTERFYRIDLLVRRPGGARLPDMAAELEVSRATLMRDLAYLRERLGVPIAYDRAENRYVHAPEPGAQELPGLWFSDQEIHALLTMHQLIKGLDAQGVLARHLQPLLDKLQGLLGAGGTQASELERRVRVQGVAHRPVDATVFERVGAALVARQRLRVRYYTRARRSEGERELSAQRLVHHRHTWYLDAWCHRANGLRRFSLDAMREVHVLPVAAQEVALGEVERALDGSYGAFAGPSTHTAELHFSPQAAQWVAHEQWHPQQQARLLIDGSLRLRVPYSDPTELVMDILRHGPQVEVLKPAGLRAQVARQLQAALQPYQ